MKNKSIKNIAMICMCVLMIWPGAVVGATENNSPNPTQSVSGGDLSLTGGPFYTIYGVQEEERYKPPVVIVANEGYEILVDGKALDTPGIVLMEEGNYAVSFQIRRNCDGAITDTITQNITLVNTSLESSEEFINDLIKWGIVIDRNAPTGTVTVSDKSWNGFTAVSTFSEYKFSDNTVTITAADDYSGVSKIEYLISETAYCSTEALEAGGPAWKEYSDSAKPSICENVNQIIYVRITDKAGNVAYISSDGIHVKTTVNNVPERKNVTENVEKTDIAEVKSPKTADDVNAFGQIVWVAVFCSCVCVVKKLCRKTDNV